MTTPLVTVLIDTYNYGCYIEEAIESVLAQSFPLEQLEILVVDDGSTDDTRERMAKYARRVTYLYKPNGGQASAFNAGVAQARGEIVFLLDADDYFLPGKIRRIVEEFQNHPEVGIIYHQLQELDSATGKLRNATFDFVPISGFLRDDKAKLTAYYPHQTSCLAFRLDLLKRVLPMPESMRTHADAFIERVAVLLAPVLAVSEPLAVYRIHSRNLAYWDWTNSAADAVRRRAASYIVVLKEVRAWMQGHEQELAGLEPSKYLLPEIFDLQETLYQSEPPGRLRYFRFLLAKNHASADLQSVRYTAYNYMMAVFALAFGYSRTVQLRRRGLERIRSSLKGEKVSR